MAIAGGHLEASGSFLGSRFHLKQVDNGRCYVRTGDLHQISQCGSLRMDVLGSPEPLLKRGVPEAVGHLKVEKLLIVGLVGDKMG